MKRKSNQALTAATVGLTIGLMVGSMMKQSAWMIHTIPDEGCNRSPVAPQPPLSLPLKSPPTLPLQHVFQSGARLFPESCDKIKESSFDKVYKEGIVWGNKMQVLEDFYSNAAWPPKQRYSGSGPGSDLGYTTATSLQFLREVIRGFNVTSMIDLPCGDANWIFDSWETDSLELYIGLDIVKSVIDLNSQRLAHHSNKVFRHWDGVQCPLPKFSTGEAGGGAGGAPRAVDLIHSRDVLQHLTTGQGIDFLCNVFQSGAVVFVTTSFPRGSNRDIAEGDFFLADLTAAPYDLPRYYTTNKCVATHPNIERDVTCVYDLTLPWVRPWVAQKCHARVSK